MRNGAVVQTYTIEPFRVNDREQVVILAHVNTIVADFEWLQFMAKGFVRIFAADGVRVIVGQETVWQWPSAPKDRRASGGHGPDANSP